MSRCKFSKAWIGHCKEEANESGYCDKHQQEKCCSCGAQATCSCDETFQFVCGCALCDDCTHNTHPDGTNGGRSSWPSGMKSHVKKSEVWFKSWYEREKNEDIFLPGGEEKFNALREQMENKWFVVTQLSKTTNIELHTADTKQEAEEWLKEEKKKDFDLINKAFIRPPGTIEAFDIEKYK